MEREIEKSTRLSQSVLWELQKAAYSNFGQSAWAGKGVPFYITSNPFIVQAYVQLVIGYIRDCLNPMAATPLDPSKPLYFVDLGSGTGRFSYLFLKTLRESLEQLPLPKLDIRYVMTDVAVANVQAWRNHRLFQPFIADGVLDFAYYFHADTTKPLFLLESGLTLDQHLLENPLILISNYFFDTIPHDLFHTRSGNLEEGRVRITLPMDEKTEKLLSSDPAIIPFLKNYNSYHPIDKLVPYNSDEPLNEILREYPDIVNDRSFLFPVGAFQTIRYFSKLAHNKMLLIGADQGLCKKEQISQFSEFFIARHGTFSMMVNYHAIGRYFEKKGGTSLIVDVPNPRFVVSAFIMGGSSARYPEAKFAFQNYFNHFDPEDLLRLTNGFEQAQVENIDTAILLCKLGYWDPHIFRSFYDVIRKDIPKCDPDTKRLLISGLASISNNFFPVNQEEAAFILNLGVLYFDLGMYPEAIKFFERALEYHPGYNLALDNIQAARTRIAQQEQAGEFNKSSKT